MDFTTELFPYQREAVEKLRKTAVGALYMEMGTGKTRTMLELIKIRLEKDRVDAVLWFCPCNVRAGLCAEVEYQCGEFPAWLTIAGIESIAGSDRLYLQLLDLVATKRVYMVVDESNMIKNPFAKRTERITTLSEKCTYKAILNGTPVSRNEADMFAQWYVLDPRILGYRSYYSFAANHLEYRVVRDMYGREITTDQVVRVLDVEYLTERISRFSYQIKKSEIGIELPKKRRRRHCFYLTDEQEILYWETKVRFLINVDETDSTTIYKLFTALQHVASGRRVVSEAHERMKTENVFSDPLNNPRIDCFRDVVAEVRDDQAIVFAKYKQEIEELKVALREDGKTFVEYTGAVDAKGRQAAFSSFQKGEAQFFLANKQCGAYGLNMQFCHVVVFYSNDFDYATRQQAEDRVHRLGQTKDVVIHDIVGADTIDEFTADNLERKESMVALFKRWLKKAKNKKFVVDLDEKNEISAIHP